LFAAEGLEVGAELGFDLREVVFPDRAALGTKAEAVVFDFEEGDAVALLSEGFVEDKDGGLYAGVGIEYPRREGDYGDEEFSTSIFLRAL
jgi:hypothetical protein